MSNLDGATTVGAENSYPSGAGEWAARWNAATPAQREKRVIDLIKAAQTATRCIIGSHEERLENQVTTLLEDAIYIKRFERQRDEALAKLAKVAEWANRFQVGDTWDSIDSYDLGVILSEGTPTETRDTK